MYGRDRGTRRGGLARLLEDLHALEGLEWIRLLYLYPATIDDELIDTFALAGEPSHVAGRFAEYREAGVMGLIAQHVHSPARLAGLRLLIDDVLPQIPSEVGSR